MICLNCPLVQSSTTFAPLRRKLIWYQVSQKKTILYCYFYQETSLFLGQLVESSCTWAKSGISKNDNIKESPFNHFFVVLKQLKKPDEDAIVNHGEATSTRKDHIKSKSDFLQDGKEFCYPYFLKFRLCRIRFTLV